MIPEIARDTISRIGVNMASSETVLHLQEFTSQNGIRETLKSLLANKSSYSTEQFQHLCVAFRYLAPDDLFVRQATDVYIRRVVPSWHWPMLHDDLRNMTYAAALKNCISSSSLVLEIGTGAGLLAILAAKAGASHVFSCEENPYLAHAAIQNVQRAGLSDKISIINKRVQDLAIGQDIPTKCNVLLHEVMSGDIVSEGIVEAINSITSTLLVSDTIYLPDKLWANAQATRDPNLTRRHHFSTYGDINLSVLNLLAPATLKLSSVETAHLIGAAYKVLQYEIVANRLQKTIFDGLPLSVLRAAGAIGLVQWFGFSFPDGSGYENTPGIPSHWHWRYHAIEQALVTSQRQYLRCDHVDQRLLFFDSN